MNKLRLLCLDDSADDIELLDRALRRAGRDPQILHARNRDEFINAIEDQNFDLITSDSAVPGLAGLKALEIARLRHPTTPFLVVSGSRQVGSVAESLQAGAVGFVPKDRLEAIDGVVERALATAALEQRLRDTEQRARSMGRLTAAVQQLSLARDLKGIMEVVRRTARELTGADGATFVLMDDGHCYYADEDAISPLWKGRRFPAKNCISGWAMHHRQPAVIEDIYSDPRIPIDAYRTTFVKSLVMVPIRTEAPIGAIGNYWAQRHQPTAQEVELLQALANTTSVAMENVRVLEELEQRVRERTAALEFANKELEAFSYSVSHDLRAPVRAVVGFGTMLREDCSEALGAKARGHLDRICDAGRRMGVLIEDLIDLSRVSRASVLKESVDMSALAREIVTGLESSDPARAVTWVIAEQMQAHGDPGLLRIVLENLLSNAWKYSSKNPAARVEFGVASSTDLETTFFVRDNGAGFDMTYASNLFAPFQRMHHEQEFPGNGIGLATVQRIVAKHGGRVWAEAAVGEGATFSFTLPRITSERRA